MVGSKLAREIALLAHGKALYALGPVLMCLPDEKRSLVERHLAIEYADFADPVCRLLSRPRPQRRTRPGSRTAVP